MRKDRKWTLMVTRSNAVILVGTEPERTRRRPADLPRRVAGVPRAASLDGPPARPGDLAPLTRLRVDLRAVFDAAVDGGRPMVRRLNDLLARHRLAPASPATTTPTGTCTSPQRPGRHRVRRGAAWG